ncbi:two-pore potassium channel 5 isoform X2 [Quercus lobata]|uniref:two-pore potassium channel 5 isoform X2 n=1 Tax=Quercus lobata TaxID=97700 RepID=UPI001245AB98|nr:two-pore potassium channel 5 isoform X2 [Quercus lobata]
MESEPFLATQTRPQLQPILEVEEDPDVSPTHMKKSNSGLGGLHRCRTAPAMAVMRDLKPKTPQIPKPQSDDANFIIRQAIFLLFIYLSLGVLIYSFNKDNFSGFAFFHILLSGVVNYVLDLQENMILTGIKMNSKRQQGFSAGDCIVDVEKGRMRIRLKVGLALGVVVLSIGIGTLVLYFVEDLDWMDSFYLSVMSVTTVGYGDRAFKTLPGRLFAVVWLLFSTLMVARAFLYLVEARIDKRHRSIAKWVLSRDITVQDLLAADVNNNGFISKSEYVIYKLKEMGKIGEKDILLICDHFSKLDRNNSGKITLPDL